MILVLFAPGIKHCEQLLEKHSLVQAVRLGG